VPNHLFDKPWTTIRGQLGQVEHLEAESISI
jgi:hypothetical protein